MTRNKIAQEKFNRLRRQAEDLMKDNAFIQPPDAVENPLQLIHELSTYQIELELQNEELQLSQQALMESRESYARLYDFAPVGYLTVSRKGRIQKVNLTFADMLSTERSALVNQPFSTCILPEDQDIYFVHCRKLKESGMPQRCKLRIQKKDGTCFYVNLESSAVSNKDKAPEQYRTVVIDISEYQQIEQELTKYRDSLEELVEQRTADLKKEITQHRRVQEELKKSEQRFRAIADYATDWETWLDPKGRVLWTNPSMERLTGFTMAEYTGLSLDERIKKIVWPEDQPEVIDHLKKGLSEKASGNDLPFRIFRKNGEIRWVSMSFQPIYGISGEYLGLRNSIRDITERKNHEQEKKMLEGQLMQAQKMEALGALSSGIAHDFNNILTSIIAYTQLLEMRHFPDDGYVKNSLTQILHSAYQARDLVSQIMTFSRKTDPAKEPVLLEHVVRDLVKMLRPSLPSTIKIIEQTKFTHCTVFADPSQMHQVLMNLCTNAAHAMKSRGGILKISLDLVNLSGKQCRSIDHIAPGKYVEITISDTGCGISAENIRKIFDPYFTTKKTGEGTGLGLSVSHGIVKNHDGAVIVSSRPDQGSIFKVFIPYFLQEIPGIKQTEPDPIPPGTAGILFVDDDVNIAEGIQKVLKNSGYDIIYKTTGKQALEALNQTPDRFDVVITDLTMPEMTGDVLAAQIKKIRPDLPVILCSGLPEEHHDTLLSKYKVDAFIQKPYNKEHLIQAIHKVIDK
ncbi:MAG: PAS domain S-box protein [Proteobacteria bacterium]|nr:PAS domain S-box protein [Pseudomonadota bacterium]MBU1584530.1 PAS domain S-box protein [Pseudomonadota bacterium]MBU2629468.1 PAS domain S-box protein [Pseudomonadota bacterium]